MNFRVRKSVAVVVLSSLLGCAARSMIPVADLANPPRSEAYFVTTAGGEEMEFIAIKASPDTLSGTVRTVKQRVVGQGDQERVEVRNQYREVALPMSQVRKVEIRKASSRGLLFAAASAAVAGGVLIILNRSGNDTGGGGGGGRTPPPLGGGK